jgi:hypothetical protein
VFLEVPSPKCSWLHSGKSKSRTATLILKFVFRDINGISLFQSKNFRVGTDEV